MNLIGTVKIVRSTRLTVLLLTAFALPTGSSVAQGRVASEWSMSEGNAAFLEPPAGGSYFGLYSASEMLFGSNRDAAMKVPYRRFSPFSTAGIAARVGINGIGFDVATPLANRFNLRMGGDFFTYSDSFAEEGANVGASVHLMSGHGALDWFPFGNSFRVSPLVVVGNGNRVRATAVVPGGSNITLGGGNYISSLTDPLHGSGSVDFRKTAPGLSAGFGNLVPRSRKHFSFPMEAGFFYVGQPTLKVAFTGSACDPTQPAAIGCQSVDLDTDFQKSLNAFRLRNNNNLKYASFYPIFSTGIGYRF